MNENASPRDDTTLVNMSLIPLDFKDSGKIPRRFYFENENDIPRFTIKNPPVSTKYLAIIMEDVDAPGKDHTHWIVYNIDPSETEIGGEIVVGFTGKNSWTMQRYHGINPIQGEHHYRFSIYALEDKINMKSDYNSSDLKKVIIGRSIEHNFITAYAERKGSFSLE